MINYSEGELWTSSGDKLSNAGKINGRPVIYRHHLIFAMTHGYLPDRVGTAADGTLYDMVYGPPVTDAHAVANCRLWSIMQKFPDLSPREVAAIRSPIPETVRQVVMDYFNAGSIFVPSGDAVVDKATGGIRLRRFVIHRMVEDGQLWYDGACYRST